MCQLYQATINKINKQNIYSNKHQKSDGQFWSKQFQEEEEKVWELSETSKNFMRLFNPAKENH